MPELSALPRRWERPPEEFEAGRCSASEGEQTPVGEGVQTLRKYSTEGFAVGLPVLVAEIVRLYGNLHSNGNLS